MRSFKFFDVCASKLIEIFPMSIVRSVYLKKNENGNLGFSLLGKEGYPHIIYDVVEDSPAADNQVC